MPFYRTPAALQERWPLQHETSSVKDMKHGLNMLVCVLLTSSCGAWPDIEPSSQTQNGTWPTLLPLDQVAGARQASPTQAEAQRLAARAANLRARAQIMRQTVADQEAFEALRARLAR
jgi:hypothetical protein